MMIDTPHYEDLLAIPFEYGGRGDGAYDCWGLVMEMLRRDGIEPVDYGWADESHAIQTMMMSAEASDWEKVEIQPRTLLLFKIGRFVRHVGYMVSDYQFVHCWERSGGVVVESLNEDWSKRIVGCYKYAK